MLTSVVAVVGASVGRPESLWMKGGTYAVRVMVRTGKQRDCILFSSLFFLGLERAYLAAEICVVCLRLRERYCRRDHGTAGAKGLVSFEMGRGVHA